MERKSTTSVNASGVHKREISRNEIRQPPEEIYEAPISKHEKSYEKSARSTRTGFYEKEAKLNQSSSKNEGPTHKVRVSINIEVLKNLT